MDAHSETLLAEVHPALAQVLRLAAQDPQPFRVVYGLRTLAAEEAAVASGHSQTLHSRHLACPVRGGLAMAADIACLDDEGAIDWTVADASGGIYAAAAAQILAQARAMGVAVQWGGQAVGAWIDGVASHFRDWGHFQLDPKEWPC